MTLGERTACPALSCVLQLPGCWASPPLSGRRDHSPSTAAMHLHWPGADSMSSSSPLHQLLHAAPSAPPLRRSRARRCVYLFFCRCAQRTGVVPPARSHVDDPHSAPGGVDRSPPLCHRRAAPRQRRLRARLRRVRAANRVWKGGGWGGARRPVARLGARLALVMGVTHGVSAAHLLRRHLSSVASLNHTSLLPLRDHCRRRPLLRTEAAASTLNNPPVPLWTPRSLHRDSTPTPSHSTTDH